MLTIALEDGGSLHIEDCGDDIKFTRYDSDGLFIEDVIWDTESIVDMVFI